MLEEVVDEEALVRRRGDLCHEHRVLRIAGRLRVVREPGLHRVAHLMAERRDLVERALVVEKDQGRHAMAVCRIGTAHLARRLEDIDPAGGHAPLHGRDVVVSQRSERLVHEVAGLLERVAALGSLDDGHIDIPVAQVVDAEDALPELHVAVHRLGMGMDRVDEGAVDRYRHLGRHERRLERALVVAGIGEELELAHLRSKRGGCRVLDLCIGAIDAVVAALAERPVRRGEDQRRVGAVRHGMLLALGVHSIRELHVCVVHHREDLARLRCKHACLCKELLLLRAQRMGLECMHAVERKLVERKARRALIPCGKVGIGKCKECWLEPGTGGIDSGLERDDLRDRVLPAAHAGILVGLPAGIVPDALELHRRLVVEFEIGKKVLAGSEGLVLPGGVGMRQLLRFDECLSEGILICEE